MVTQCRTLVEHADATLARVLCKPNAASAEQSEHPPASGCKKTYEETLLDVYEYSKAVGLPYRHVQIDSWWCE